MERQKGQMEQDALLIILAEIRQLRTDVNAELLWLKGQINPSNAELERIYTELKNDVKTLSNEVAGLKEFKIYFVAIASFIVLIVTLVSKHLGTVLSWLGWK